MAQTKIYPATQAQAEEIQQTVDEINAKITTPTYQVKTVTPSNVQQMVQADTGYTALSGVVVNPIAALMPQTVEDYILKNNQGMYFTLNLNGEIPSYACYNQRYLIDAYGSITSIEAYAFAYCSSLQNINLRNTASIAEYAFYACTSLFEVDARSLTSFTGDYSFGNCSSLKKVDVRNATQLIHKVFEESRRLEYVDARKCLKYQNSVFWNCTSLKLLDMTQTNKSAVLQSTVPFFGTPNSMIMLVANDDEKIYYQSATNWSNYATRYKTIAEFEQEIGMPYDEYYLQIFGHARNEVQP